MKKYLFIVLLVGPIFYLKADEIVIYSTESAQYFSNDCCTLNSLTIQNGGTLYSQDCQDMGSYYGCGMAKQVPLWSFDLSSLDTTINITSIHLNGDIIGNHDWSGVYLSMSSMTGPISAIIASHLWSGGDNSISGIDWPRGAFSQILPIDIASEILEAGQLNILAFTSEQWQFFTIENSGNDAPRLVIEYEDALELGSIINIPDDFPTIQLGIDAASDGDTVMVSSGTYVENINWPTTSAIRLIGVHMDSTIIDGGGVGKVIDNSDDTSHPNEISNLTIQNGYTTGKGGGISLKMTGDIILKNIRVNNNQANFGGGIHIEGEGSVSFVQTVVHIENAIISNNNATSSDGGIDLDGDFISSIIKNSTIVNNSSVSGGGGIDAGSPGNYAIIVNSIFWNNQPANTDGIVIPYYSNIDVPFGTNNIFTDPSFIDDDNDFHLSIGSPCIDSGTGFLVVDLSGQMLPGVLPDTVISLNSISYFGIAPDMGAFETYYANYYGPIWHVATSGSDEIGDGSVENPFATIQSGINAANDGDTVLVAVGTYVENINYNNKQLVVASHFIDSDGDDDFILNTIIDGDSTSSCVKMNASGAKLIGFTLTNGYAYSYEYGGSAITIDDPSEVSYCVITKNNIDPSFNDGAPILIYNEGNSSNFDHLTILDNEGGYYEDMIVVAQPISSDIFNISNTLFISFEYFGGYRPTINQNNNYNYNGNNPMFCDPNNENYSLSANSPLVGVGENETNIGALGVGCEAIELVIDQHLIPNAYFLQQNYPNPFNPVTLLRYGLSEDGLVIITIYDMMGRIVNTLVNGYQTAGFKSVQWNATNDRNESVSAGLYLYTLQADGFKQTKKMILLK